MQKDGGNQATGNSADEQGHEQRHGIRGSHGIGNRQEQGDGHGGRESGQCAEHDADGHTDEHQEQAGGGQYSGETAADQLKSRHDPFLLSPMLSESEKTFDDTAGQQLLQSDTERHKHERGEHHGDDGKQRVISLFRRRQNDHLQEQIKQGREDKAQGRHDQNITNDNGKGITQTP